MLHVTAAGSDRFSFSLMYLLTTRTHTPLLSDGVRVCDLIPSLLFSPPLCSFLFSPPLSPPPPSPLFLPPPPPPSSLPPSFPQVVVKFICKATVIPEHWVQHEVMGLVPLEICILAELTHPNVVQVHVQYM